MNMLAIRFSFVTCVLAISALAAHSQAGDQADNTSKVIPQLPVPPGPFGIGRVPCHWIRHLAPRPLLDPCPRLIAS